MTKENILNIGIGNYGNRLVDAIRRKDSRYETLMVDSNRDTIFSLDDSDECGKLIIPPSCIGDDLLDVYSIFIGYDKYDFVLYFDIVEYFASIYAINIAKTIRNFVPHSKITVVSTFPKTSPLVKSRTECENILNSWNELMKLKDGVVDEFKIIDSNRDKTMAEISESLTKELKLDM